MNHQCNFGTYNVHIYGTTNTGIYGFVGGTTFDITASNYCGIYFIGNCKFKAVIRGLNWSGINPTSVKFPT